MLKLPQDSILVKLVQQTQNSVLEVYLDAQRGSGRGVVIHNTPLLVNQELGEVPLDAVTEEATLARLQEFVDGCGIVTVDINLTSNKSLGSVLLHKELYSTWVEVITNTRTSFCQVRKLYVCIKTAIS